MNDSPIGKQVIYSPDSTEAIHEEAEKLLKRAKAIGIYPTPIDELIRVAGIKEITDFEEMKASFLKTASSAMASQLNSAWNKLRGIADLKKSVIFTTPSGNMFRQNWAKLHELGHQKLEWQNIQRQFLDDNKSLSAECEDLFDIEANIFASEVLFQGKNFKEIAGSYKPDFSNFFSIAEMHGASRQSTARRFVEFCDEPIFLASYYQSKFSFSTDGSPIFILGRAHSHSESFINKYQNLIIPQRIDNKHEWYKALSTTSPINGSIDLKSIEGENFEFLWEAWWNQYRLLVVLRRTPKLRLLKSAVFR